MNIFKLMSMLVGTVITISAAYKAQAKVNEFMQQRQLIKTESPSNSSIRVITVFIVTTVVGGFINNTINQIFASNLNAHPGMLS